MSQGHGGARVFELAGEHASVELVELHQVDQVGELGGAVVEAEEHLTVFLALSQREERGQFAIKITRDTLIISSNRC